MEVFHLSMYTPNNSFFQFDIESKYKTRNCKLECRDASGFQSIAMQLLGCSSVLFFY